MTLKSSSLKFVPPKEELKAYRYASYAGSEMKLHGGIGFAKNSLNNRMWTRVDTDEVAYTDSLGKTHFKMKSVTKHAFLLEQVEGEWFVLYEIQPGSTRDELPWMKEYYYSYGRWNLLTPYIRESSYYAPKLASGEHKTSFRPTPMTTDEYVEWRLAVERERLGIV